MARQKRMSLLTSYVVRRIDCLLLEQQRSFFRSKIMRDSREAEPCFILTAAAWQQHGSSMAAAWHVFAVDNHGWIPTLTYPCAS
jgi:hypothetical protein